MKIPDLIILNKFIYKLPAIKIGISALEEGVLNTGFIREDAALRSNPRLPFYIPFLNEKVPFSNAFYCQNGTSYLDLCSLLTTENELSLKY